MLRVLFSNIIGFDGIIFLFACFQGYVFWRAWKAILKIYAYMHPNDYVPTHQSGEAPEGTEAPKEPDVVKDLEEATFWYTLFGNMTAVFPLLGILGTVSALIGMVGDLAAFQGSFYLALTSTFWGLIFAIASKAADTVLSSKLEDDERAVELYLQRRDQKKK